MDQKQRLALFVSTLEQAPAAFDGMSARKLVDIMLNGVEDAHSGLPYEPDKWMTHDRIYPPQDDQKQINAIAGATLYHARRHSVWFGDNGSIRIEVRMGPDRGLILLDKPGADGALCPR
jgi:hypothetical protein